jgi:hypothetical protein
VEDAMPEIMNDKQVHLTFIQETIRRMSQNAFLIKGWCVGIVSALLAFSVKEGLPTALKVAFLPIMFLWLLDGYYTSLERRYRRLYDEVRAGESLRSDYSMDAASFRGGNARLYRSLLSGPIVLLYLALAIVIDAINFATGETMLARTLIDFARVITGSIGMHLR